MSTLQPFAIADRSPHPTLRHNVRAVLWLEVWLVVAGLLTIDLVWGTWIGFSIGGWARVVGATVVLLALAAAYQHRSRPLADMAAMAALWVALSATGAVLTYLAATCALPLQDDVLMRYDQALGFDWVVWRDTVAASPSLRLVLLWTYDSLSLQTLLSCLLLPALGMTGRCAELVRLVVLTLIPTTLVSTLYPVLGPLSWSGGEQPQFLADLQILRATGPWHFDLAQLQGIIQMPSYHTVLAGLFVYAYRDTGLIGWMVVILNSIMLFSIPVFGGHYLCDMLAGATIALFCILIYRFITKSWKTGQHLVT